MTSSVKTLHICVFYSSSQKQLQSLDPLTGMKLEAKNLGFCMKLSNYVVLFTKASLDTHAGYVPVYTVFLFILSYYSIYLTSYSFIYKVDYKGSAKLLNTLIANYYWAMAPWPTVSYANERW